MHRISTNTLVALAAVALLSIPASSQAQFGGLIKKKIAQTAIDKAIPQPAAPRNTASRRGNARTMRPRATR